MSIRLNTNLKNKYCNNQKRFLLPNKLALTLAHNAHHATNAIHNISGASSINIMQNPKSKTIYLIVLALPHTTQYDTNSTHIKNYVRHLIKNARTKCQYSNTTTLHHTIKLDCALHHNKIKKMLFICDSASNYERLSGGQHRIICNIKEILENYSTNKNNKEMLVALIGQIDSADIRKPLIECVSKFNYAAEMLMLDQPKHNNFVSEFINSIVQAKRYTKISTNILNYLNDNLSEDIRTLSYGNDFTFNKRLFPALSKVEIFIHNIDAMLNADTCIVYCEQEYVHTYIESLKIAKYDVIDSLRANSCSDTIALTKTYLSKAVLPHVKPRSYVCATPTSDADSHSNIQSLVTEFGGITISEMADVSQSFATEFDKLSIYSD